MKFKMLKEYDHSFYFMKPDLSGKFNKGDYREPTFNREKDYLESKASELEVRKHFISKGFEFIREGGFMYDVMFKCTKEPFMVEEWPVKKYWTIEVKESFKSQLTGNVPIEFQQRGRSTGIAQTQAEFWIEKIHEPNGKITFTMIKTADLKKMIADEKYFRIAVGGDPGSESKVYLFKLDVFKQHGKTLNIKTY